MKIIALAVAIFWSMMLGAETYRYTDEKGGVHYSDKPVAGATKIQTKPRSASSSEEAELEPVDSTPKPKARAACVNRQVIDENSQVNSRGERRSFCLDDL